MGSTTCSEGSGDRRGAAPAAAPAAAAAAGPAGASGAAGGPRMISKSELAAHGSEWLAIGNRVYDVSEYIARGEHPGGEAVLKRALGGDATAEFEDAGHSAAARHLLESFFVGYVEGSGEEKVDEQRLGAAKAPVLKNTNFKLGKVDFSRPIMAQVYNLNREEYLSFSNMVQCCSQSCRFFESDYLEVLSRTVWWLIPLIWLPVSYKLAAHTKAKYGLSSEASALLFLVGFLCWTPIEYVIHRFIFHFPEPALPDVPLVRLIHFLGHAVHHVLPMDSLRLVMPPALFISLQLPFYALFSLALPQWLLRAAWAGFILGYVCYDLIHYAEHHFPITLPGLYYMKVYHMKHHFKYPNLIFGVTNPFWDYVFGTGLPPGPEPKAGTAAPAKAVAAK